MQIKELKSLFIHSKMQNIRFIYPNTEFHSIYIQFKNETSTSLSLTYQLKNSPHKK